ncbi:cytochrome c peroxidase [Hydrocarboniphaga sp.]|uniref:cytochrome-c peroxidase n=1 Tax=Hydrocarboniphaga sp. TaxID=2033016 RepID=UPI0026095874|nr:cytochrome c peroxidase [Hydrocarboniphaga sp.]
MDARPADADPWLRPAQVPAPESNAPTAERVELGKALFFDPRLSGSNWISCASCHNPALGWSDGLPTGMGHGMKPLGRGTPTILNTAYNPLQMWDGRFKDLEQQALGPMGSGAEMNQDLGSVATEFAAIAGYRARFDAAYPGESISTTTIAKAIASFERTVVSGEAPFDRWRRGDAAAIGASAQRGFELFKGKAECGLCHMGWNFTDNGFHNIGLNSEDPGRYAQKPLKSMKGAFKTPTLRDVALTAPYMHNGMYASLEEVIEHYDRGGDLKDNLSPSIRPLGLTVVEKRDLLEFLKTLTGAPMLVVLPQLPQ